MTLYLTKSDRRIIGDIHLAGSKSISNRALIIRALSGQDFPIHRLANAHDTELLDGLLRQSGEVYDAGPAGTTFRFLTAYLSGQPGTQILTGTERMKQRPIGVLVDALRRLGAQIEYVEKEGYPPLRILAPSDFGRVRELSIPASTSSQYISALLMIAPTLRAGLSLRLEGKIVSRPYIEMTLRLMAHFGITYTWEGDTIQVAPQAYQARPFTVEADWSAASYYYSLAAMADEVNLTLHGLFEESTQGDAVIAEIMQAFGVATEYGEGWVRLRKAAAIVPEETVLEKNFIRCPDLAQTVAVACAGTGVRGVFTGLETLRIKETDRIGALQQELKKVGVSLQELPPMTGEEYFEVSGQAKVNDRPVFATYEDHRMAMAFAPLAMLGEIGVEEPMVVRKSYPDFWVDFAKLGVMAI